MTVSNNLHKQITRHITRRYSKKHTKQKVQKVQNEKQIQFTSTLMLAKKALDEAKIPFHLHSGTALGAIREQQFIEHDNDIDLGVFIKDYKRSLVTYMKKYGFILKNQNGKLNFGKEYMFYHKKTGVNLDIFLVYEDKKENFYWVASFYGKCNDMKYGLCRWKYRPYIPSIQQINTIKVYSMPLSAIEDAYGPRWNIPKEYDYFEGVEQGYYTNLINE